MLCTHLLQQLQALCTVRRCRKTAFDMLHTYLGGRDLGRGGNFKLITPCCRLRADGLVIKGVQDVLQYCIYASARDLLSQAHTAPAHAHQLC